MSDLYYREIYVSRAGDEEPSGEMYFLRVSPAGNGRINTYANENLLYTLATKQLSSNGIYFFILHCI